MSANDVAAWTRADLDRLGCQVPGCTQKHHHGPLFLHTKCHPKRPSAVHYHHGGVLEISCHKCGRLNVRIRVAPHEQAELDQTALACGKPDCSDPPEQHFMRLRSPCHRNSGLWVAYSGGQLTIACGRCHQLVPVSSSSGGLDVKPASAEA